MSGPFLIDDEGDDRLAHMEGARYPLDALVQIMARLRSEDGCPWDLEQDHRTLKPYVIEEAYELLDAIDETLSGRGDAALIEELGDLLLQVVFHARIAEESDRFDVNDVVRGIVEKLIRRHPHVFADAQARDSAAVMQTWEKVKRQEKVAAGKEEDGSLLDRIPRALPALSLALELQKRAAKVGFEWPTVEGALDKLVEEAGEVAREQEAGAAKRLEEEWGDLLFSMVNVIRYSGIDPESALVGAAGRFRRRFQHIERRAAEDGRDLDQMSLDEMDALWNEAKL